MIDNNYFGIYRAVVVDGNDPEGLGRATLKIPQVFGNTVTEWAWPVGGALSQHQFPYGTFFTSSSQTLGVNTPTLVTGWAESDTNRSYLDNNRLYVQETGDYLFQFSAMLTKTNASLGAAEIWIRKNGTDIPDSNTRVTLSGNNAETVMTVSLILDLDAGDYLQLFGSASATDILITAVSAGSRPAIPGIIASLNLVGKWKPQPGTGVWAMFEGGDPNFPLWIGAF